MTLTDFNSIQKNRPNIAETTFKTYSSSVRRILRDFKLKRDIDIDSLDDFTKHYKDILDMLITDETMSPLVRKSKIAAIVVLIDDADNSSKELKEALLAYRKQMTEDVKTVEKHNMSQDLTDKIKENLLTQEQVMTVYKNLKAQVLPLFKLDKLDKRQLYLMQLYVILSLYVLIPPRRALDYTNFKIRNFDMSEKSRDNYMFNYNSNKRKGLSTFVFNSYKNSGKLGSQYIENIPKSLEKIIKDWSKYNRSDYLLINQSGGQLTGSKLAIYLNQIFQLPISVSMLRHIYTTTKYGHIDLSEIQDDAKAMGNSGLIRTLQYAHNKKDKDEEEEDD